MLEWLKEFEFEGVVKWDVIFEILVCIEYLLIDKGKVLVFILGEIFKWVMDWIDFFFFD